jgi:hypothetical protein
MNRARRVRVSADHGRFHIQDLDGQRAAEADEDYDWPRFARSSSERNHVS